MKLVTLLIDEIIFDDEYWNLLTYIYREREKEREKLYIHKPHKLVQLISECGLIS